VDAMGGDFGSKSAMPMQIPVPQRGVPFSSVF